MIAILTVGAVCAGLVLGTRFKIITLVPAIGLILVASTVLGIARSAGFGATVLAAAAAIIGLQLGYLGGVGARLALGRSENVRDPKRNSKHAAS